MMTADTLILTLAGLLQLVLMLVHGTYIALAFGPAWGLGRRDTPRVPSDLGRRIERTLVNNTEHMMVFLPVFLAVIHSGPVAPTARLAAASFLAARVVFAALYYGNVPYLRTLVWFIGHACILAMVWRLIVG